MRIGARPQWRAAGRKMPSARPRARARSKGKKKKKSLPRGARRQLSPELAGERACASAQRRPPPLLCSVGGLAQGSAVPASPRARTFGVSTSRLAEREEEGSVKERKRWTGLGEREKPPSQSVEPCSRVGVRKDTPPPFTPLGSAGVLWRLEQHRSDKWTTIPRRRCGAEATPGSTRAAGFIQFAAAWGKTTVPRRPRVKRFGSGQPGSHSGHWSWRCFQRIARGRTPRSWGPRGGQPGRPGPENVVFSAFQGLSVCECGGNR